MPGYLHVRLYRNWTSHLYVGFNAGRHVTCICMRSRNCMCDDVSMHAYIACAARCPHYVCAHVHPNMYVHLYTRLVIYMASSRRARPSAAREPCTDTGCAMARTSHSRSNFCFGVDLFLALLIIRFRCHRGQADPLQTARAGAGLATVTFDVQQTQR